MKEYHYKITYINEEERWIYIASDDEMDMEEPDAFVYLVKKIQKDLDGDIKEVGIMQYQIGQDLLSLVHQWDDLFGTVVIYPNGISKDRVIEFLEKYF